MDKKTKQQEKKVASSFFQLKVTKIAFLAAAITLWGGCIYISINSEKKPSKVQSNFHLNNMIPKWMPTSWVSPFLKQYQNKFEKNLFQNNLQSLSNQIEHSPWIKSVHYLQRNFLGKANIALQVRKPICLLKMKRKQIYLDENMEYLPLLSHQHTRYLNDKKLPEVNVTKIEKDSSLQKKQWLSEMVNFINTWNKEKIVTDRFDLDQITLLPYKSRKFQNCRLSLTLIDKKFKKNSYHKTILEWGINQKYNELEDRKASDKWTDLKNAISQGKSFKTLDLRYKEAGILF